MIVSREILNKNEAQERKLGYYQAVLGHNSRIFFDLDGLTYREQVDATQWWNEAIKKFDSSQYEIDIDDKTGGAVGSIERQIKGLLILVMKAHQVQDINRFLDRVGVAQI